jgi:quinol monooxygenase YgiN
MKFVQMIEYETARPAEMEAAFEEWVRATEGKRTASHELHTQDTDNPARFIDIVEFPSHEEAMVNNELPATRRIAAQMRDLCTSEPQFHDLQVLREEDL